jgi:hypothetical protein
MLFPEDKVHNFINTYIADLIGFEEEDLVKSTCFSFENSEYPYYVYFDRENHGYFNQEGKFITQAEADQIIENQLSGDHREMYDRIIFFDVKQNKVIKPKLK